VSTITHSTGTETRTEQTRTNRFAHALADPMADYYLVLISTAILLAFGLVFVLSSSSAYDAAAYGDQYTSIKQQLRIVVVGIPAALILSRCSERIFVWLGWIGLLLAVVLLTLVLIPGIGIELYGQQSWLPIGSVSTLQPSEFAKLAVIVWSAANLSNMNRHGLLDKPKTLLLPFLPVNLLVLGLILVQPDAGTAAILGMLIMMQLWFAGAPWKVLGSLLGLAVAGLAALIATNPERMSRILGFAGVDGAQDSSQPANALLGMAQGSWWGVGLGASSQKWGGLFNGAQTDYVLAVVGEELGLFGVLLLLVLFAVFCFAGVRIAMNSQSVFLRLVAAGITSWIGLQAAVNVFMVFGLFPVIGVPLPFISFGGSALLSNLMAVGILLACARLEPGARSILGAKGASLPRMTGVVAASGNKGVR
jgi:cell division protein FtsW